MEPSLPDTFEQTPSFAHYGGGGGSNNNNTGDGIQYNNNSMGHQNNGSGQQFNGTNHIVYATVDDINRFCLRSLRCPDTLVVKNRLKENKDKLLHKAIEWILQDPQYLRWKDGDDVCLLWIKGGAGKGKTMMSIGLIEQLSRLHDASTVHVVTYFFCQNADSELNTIEAIIKGLILQLVNQQEELKRSLRSRWDTVTERFVEDVSSWRMLWDIFLEMLHQCNCLRVYVIVDALDECQDDGMANFLRLLVRTGLDYPSKFKWLLTSRPLDSAEQELLNGSDQVLVSLELNSRNISEAVTTYITVKVAELDRRNDYGPTLRQEIQDKLAEKAEDTYLWVSLVCKRLEGVRRDEALTTIQDLPPGLYPFYNRVLNQLSLGESAVVRRCMRLLKVMMLAYRPLNLAEVDNISGLSNEWVTIGKLVDRCSSFFRIRGTDIEFVYQLARDYLAGTSGQSVLDSYERYGHAEIALSYLSHLTNRLKVNLADLPQPYSTRKLGNPLVVSVDYTATFWMQHLEEAKQTTLIQNALAEQGEVGIFLRNKLLEWLECLSLLDKLPRAIKALIKLADVVAVDAKKNVFLSVLIEDAKRFLLRHYQTIVTWPLQIYSSAIVFSPQTSIVRRNNLDKVPTWLKTLPQVEDAWASLIQTLVGHSDLVMALTFSPDGKQIASVSSDKTIKLWDATTGDLQRILVRHSESVRAVAFSPDGKQIASVSSDNTIKLWDATTGDLQKTLVGRSDLVMALTFSPDGKQIASGSTDKTIKLWDATTGDLQRILVRHSESVRAVAFSPDGKLIASGSNDNTIKLWDISKPLKASTFDGYFELPTRWDNIPWLEFNTSGTVKFLKFSEDNRHLITNLGPIEIESIPAKRQTLDFKPLDTLSVGKQWIYYGAVPVFRLPSEIVPHRYYVSGDRVAIGLVNGQVLSFGIDWESLRLILKRST